MVVMITGSYKGLLFSSRETSSRMSKVKLFPSNKDTRGLDTDKEYTCSSSALKPIQLLKRSKK